MSKLRLLRDASGFMHGNILVLTVTGALGMFCRSMVFPYASLYVLSLGGEPAQIGFINSLGPLAGLLVFPIAGYLTDVAGRVKLISLAGYLSGLVLLLYVFAPTWHLVALGSLLLGFMVFQFPPSSAIVADSLSPATRARGVATMRMITGTVAMLSPYAAGLALDTFGVTSGMQALYAVMALFAFVSATVNRRFLSETAPRLSEKLTLSQLMTTLTSAYASIPETLSQLPRSLCALAAIVVLGFVANAFASPFWVVYAVEEMHISAAEWGLILLVETSARNLIYIPAGRLVDRYGKTRLLLAALLVSLVAIPSFLLAASFGAVLLIRAALAVATAFFIPACTALIADSVPRAIRGRVMAVIGSGTLALGAASGGTGGPGVGLLTIVPLVIASLSGGYLYAANPKYPWILVTATTAVSIGLLLAFVRDPEQAEV